MRPPPLATPPSCPLDRLAAVVPGARLTAAPGSAPSAAGASEGVPLVRGVTHDSRAVRAGDLFAALPGAHGHGADHAGAAVAAGAVAVLTDASGLAAAARCGAPVLVVPDAGAALGPVAAQAYDHPSRDLHVVGVTGTDGKTTTAWLVAAALEAAGVATGLLGSVEVRLGDATVLAEEPQHRRTTPEAGELQETLALVRERGGAAVAMEASSHGLALGRTAGTRFAVGVFTNLGHDHLDFHGGVEGYLAAKARLVEVCEHAVVNVDDPYGARLAAARARDRPMSTVSTATAAGGRGGPAPTWRAVDVTCRPTSSTFTALGPHGAGVDVEVRLAGRFNVDNALAALAAAVVLGVDPGDAARGLGSLEGVPGRMHWVVPDGEVRALVDYAHTPGALAALLATARSAAGEGRVVLVVGTGGGRDVSKRAAMGRAAAAGADVVVLTDDNPRHEDPAAIRRELRAGARQVGGAEVHEVADRTAAVRAAAGLARPGDVVVVAGKGPDRVQLVGERVLPVDDAATLRRWLGRSALDAAAS